MKTKRYNETVLALQGIVSLLDHISMTDDTNVKINANIVRSHCLVCEVKFRQHIFNNRQDIGEFYLEFISLYLEMISLKRLLIDTKMEKEYLKSIDGYISCLAKTISAIKSAEIMQFNLQFFETNCLYNLN